MFVTHVVSLRVLIYLTCISRVAQTNVTKQYETPRSDLRNLVGDFLIVFLTEFMIQCHAIHATY